MITHPHLECRPSGYYFRRRIPCAPPVTPGGARKSGTPAQTGAVCLSLRTQFLSDAKRIARRLTAASDLLFAARTEQDMLVLSRFGAAPLIA